MNGSGIIHRQRCGPFTLRDCGSFSRLHVPSGSFTRHSLLRMHGKSSPSLGWITALNGSLMR
jgi:hypothetical protein